MIHIKILRNYIPVNRAYIYIYIFFFAVYSYCSIIVVDLRGLDGFINISTKQNYQFPPPQTTIVKWVYMFWNLSIQDGFRPIHTAAMIKWSEYQSVLIVPHNHGTLFYLEPPLPMCQRKKSQMIKQINYAYLQETIIKMRTELDKRNHVHVSVVYSLGYIKCLL